ncbi:hypothetical protein ABKT14_22585, partial [Enterobacter roggenkampii]
MQREYSESGGAPVRCNRFQRSHPADPELDQLVDLGSQGVNIMEFCKAFNAKTESLEKGLPIPVVITVYADRSF